MFWFTFLLTLGTAISLGIVIFYNPVYGYLLNLFWLLAINEITGYVAYSPKEMQLITIVWLGMALLERIGWLAYRKNDFPLREMIVGGSAAALLTSAFTTIWTGGLVGGAIIGVPLLRHSNQRGKFSLLIFVLGKLIPYFLLLTFWLFLVWGASLSQ